MCDHDTTISKKVTEGAVLANPQTKLARNSNDIATVEDALLINHFVTCYLSCIWLLLLNLNSTSFFFLLL